MPTVLTADWHFHLREQFVYTIYICGKVLTFTGFISNINVKTKIIREPLYNLIFVEELQGSSTT